MDETSKRFVVVGGGNSAGYLAKEIVERGEGSELLIISDEDVLPYERPALTKGFLFPDNPARLPGFHTSVGGGGERQTAEWYKDHGVEVMLNSRVVAADFVMKTVTTSNGEVIDYETLIIATGCSAARLPAAIGGELQKAFYIRNHADALELYSQMELIETAVVVGGGYIGLEVAAALSANSVKTEMVFPEGHLMARLWTPEIAQFYEDFYTAQGIKIHKNAKVARIQGSGWESEGCVTGVELESGEVLDADICVLGLGARPAAGPFEVLAEPQSDDFPGGIPVNGKFEVTNLPPGVDEGSVFAIGDIAAFPLLCAGGRAVRMEHVDHARRSAAHAAAAMLAQDGEDVDPYDYLPYFYSRVFEHPGADRKLAWQFYGLQEGEVVVVGNFLPKMAAFWVRAGRVVGIMLEGGSPEETAALPDVARVQPAVDVDKLREARNVAAALKMLGVMDAWPYVVLGGGNSAGYLARAFAERGEGSKLCIVSAEPVLPYERPALSKGFLFEESPARLPGFHTSVGGGGERQTQAWYDDKGITTLLGVTVASADCRNKILKTEDGKIIRYGTLIVATGCAPVRLPGSLGEGLKGVHYLRSNEDALALYKQMKHARRAVVVGGGYIGMEVAAALLAWGIKVTWVTQDPHLVPRLFTAEISRFYEALYAQKGVTFHKGTTITGFVESDEGKLKGVELASGETIKADTVVVGIGSQCPTALFEQLERARKGPAKGGILVDGQFRASGKGVAAGSVYAIGDVAAFPLACVGGEAVRMEHVDHARKSAAHAAAAMLGQDPEPYDYLPYFYSRMFEHPGSDRKLAWAFHGLAKGRVVTIGAMNPKLLVCWVEESQVVGIMLEGGSAAELACLPAVARARPFVVMDLIKQAASVDEAVQMVFSAAGVSGGAPGVTVETQEMDDPLAFFDDEPSPGGVEAPRHLAPPPQSQVTFFTQMLSMLKCCGVVPPMLRK